MKTIHNSPSFVLAVAAAAVLQGCAQKPAQIRVEPRKVTLYGVGSSASLKIEVLDKKGQVVAGVQPQVEVVPPKVASYAGGAVKALAPGKAKVSITAGELSESVPIEVMDVKTIELVPSRLSLFGPQGTTHKLVAIPKTSKGESVDIPVIWAASNEKVVTVTPDGTITGVSQGRAGITASVGRPAAVTAVAEVTIVFGEVASFELKPKIVLMKVGESQPLTLEVRDARGNAVENPAVVWRVSEPGVISIQPDGKVTAKAKGTATISAVLGGKTSEVTILVN